MKNKVLFQALILGCAQIGGKLLSLIFLFKLSNDIRPLGLHLYTHAYIPFSLFLDCSSFGIIPGVSKFIAKRLTKEDDKIISILKSGTVFSIGLGVLFFILLNIFNEKILNLSLSSDYNFDDYNVILTNLKIASLSLLIYPLLSFYKGFLQGHLKMLPSSIAILTENITRVVLYLIVFKVIVMDSIKYIFVINFISYIIALISIFLFVIKYYFYKGNKSKDIIPLIKTIIPIGTVTMFYTFYQLIDTLTLTRLGVTSKIYSSYMFESVRLIFIPIVFSQSIGGVLNPKFNNLCANNKYDIASNMAKRITNLMIKILVPIIFIYIFFAKEIYTFFYSSYLFYVLIDTSFLIFFIGFYKVIIGITLGIKKIKYISISTFGSCIAKIILNYTLVPKLDYNGAILSTITAITICLLVSYYILSRVKIKILFSNIKTIILTVIITLISGFIATILKISFFTNSFSLIIEISLFSLYFVLFYLLFISFINLFNNKNEVLCIE